MTRGKGLTRRRRTRGCKARLKDVHKILGAMLAVGCFLSTTFVVAAVVTAEAKVVVRQKHAETEAARIVMTTRNDTLTYNAFLALGLDVVKATQDVLVFVDWNGDSIGDIRRELDAAHCKDQQDRLCDVVLDEEQRRLSEAETKTTRMMFSQEIHAEDKSHQDAQFIKDCARRDSDSLRSRGK